ncbi:MAG: hypothetical protein WCD76_11920 [Pyrinomonadaceae bacterium]
MKKDPFKLAVAVLAGAYFLWCAYDPVRWHFIDGVNLVIHEAGHIVFMPFGEFVTIAGGSLFQVIVPSIFAGYFIHQKQYYAAALVLFWVGESLLNVSVYAGDAVRLELPLLGGDDSMHDWNFMLDRAGLLRSTAAIAGAIRLCGTLLILAGCAGAYKFSAHDREAGWSTGGE